MQNKRNRTNAEKGFTARDVGLAILLVFTLFLIYQSLFSADFISFDDSIYVYDNPDVKNGFSIEGVTKAFQLKKDSGPYWHPVTTLSHMADSHFFGLEAGKHHRTNLILHIMNSFLLWLFVLRATGKLWESLFVAVLFAVHPVNVESVAWITQRKNLLAGFFWLAGLNAFVSYCDQKRLKYLVMVYAAFVLGYMSKPVMMTFPFTLLLLNYWPLNRYSFAGDTGTFQNLKKNSLIIVETIPMIMLMLGLFFFWFFTHSEASGLSSYDTVPLKLRILNLFVSDCVYIKQLFLPVDLSVFYPFPESVSILKSSLAVLCLTAVSGIAIYRIKSIPWFAVGWFWYIGNLVVASGIIQRGYWPAHADRFVYLPYIGLFIIAVWFVSWAQERFVINKRVVGIFAVFIITGLSVLTYKQAAVWQNGVTLFSNAVTLNPEDALSYTNLAYSHGEKGETEAAIRYSYKALELNPAAVEAHNNLGVLLASTGKFNESLIHFNNALILYPDFTDALANKGLALYRLGMMNISENVFKQVLQKHHDHSIAHSGLGALNFDKKEYKTAIRHFEIIINKKTASDEDYLRYGASLLFIGKEFEATRFFRIVSKDFPNSNVMLKKIGDVFHKSGKDYEAQRYYDRAEAQP